MKKRLFKYLLYRYRSGIASPREIHLLDSWYDSLERAAGNLPDDLPRRQDAALAQALKKIDTLPRNMPWPRRWHALVAAAALLTFLFAGVYWYRLDQQKSHELLVVQPAYRIIETQAGERKQVALPDGSTVLLDARSILRIDTQQYGKQWRRVELLSGEAFFSVEKDSSRAFIVQAGALQTRVLGTSFNIQAYPEMPEQVISVYTGKVQVLHGEHVLGIIQRGEQIRFEKERANSDIETFNLDQANSWTTGRNILRQASFEELALSVRNNYGVILKAGDSRIVRQRYSIAIQERVPLADALSAICAIHNNRVRKEGDTVVIY